MSESTSEHPLPLNTAISLLTAAVRSGLVDHAFGDSEIDWHIDGVMIADGYFSSRRKSVNFSEDALKKMGYTSGDFSGEDAYKLQYLGLQGHIERNDMLGNDGYY